MSRVVEILPRGRQRFIHVVRSTVADDDLAIQGPTAKQTWHWYSWPWIFRLLSHAVDYRDMVYQRTFAFLLNHTAIINSLSGNNHLYPRSICHPIVMLFLNSINLQQISVCLISLSILHIHNIFDNKSTATLFLTLENSLSLRLRPKCWNTNFPIKVYPLGGYITTFSIRCARRIIALFSKYSNFNETLVKLLSHDSLLACKKVHLKMSPAKMAAILSLPQCVNSLRPSDACLRQ